MSDKPMVGVAVCVRRDGKILLHKRKSKHANGYWGMPGGHLEKWESLEEAAIRELEEEAGSIKTTKPQLLTTVDAPYKNEDKHYICVFMVCDWISGEAEVREPEKNDGWGWFGPSNLPSPLMEGIKGIDIFSCREDKLATAMNLLSQAADYFDERCPINNPDWFKEYFLLTGDHMVLTEYGWGPGSSEGYDMEQILDEVNKPKEDEVVV